MSALCHKQTFAKSRERKKPPRGVSPKSDQWFDQTVAIAAQIEAEDARRADR